MSIPDRQQQIIQAHAAFICQAVEFIQPKVVVPIHYTTWPPIEQDPEAFKAAVGDMAQVEVLAPGGTPGGI